MFAVLLDWQAKFVGAIRLLYFLPLVVSTAVAGVLWSTLFSPSYGMINRLLGLVGITGPTWLASTTWALPALTIVVIWLSLPLVVILYLAGLQRIPKQIFEAARIDGAGPWLRLWAIIWPNVRSTTALVLVLEILQFLAAPFEVGLIMTYGGPLDARRHCPSTRTGRRSSSGRWATPPRSPWSSSCAAARRVLVAW